MKRGILWEFLALLLVQELQKVFQRHSQFIVELPPCYPNLQIDIHDGFFALSESTGEIWSDVFQSHHARLEHAALKSSKEALGSGNANHVDIMTNNEEIMI